MDDACDSRVSICKIGSEPGEDLLPPLWETLLTPSLLRLVFPGHMNPGHIAGSVETGATVLFLSCSHVPFSVMASLTLQVGVDFCSVYS